MSFAALFARVRKQGSAAWFGSAVLAGGAVVLLLRRRGEKNKAIAPPRKPPVKSPGGARDSTQASTNNQGRCHIRITWEGVCFEHFPQ